MNNGPTSAGIDTPSTRGCSLDVLARALIRARPDLPVHLRPLASLLAEQLKSLEDYERPSWATFDCQTLPGVVKHTASLFNAEERGR